MQVSPITTYFSTNTIHEFTLFLASVILIFSLFFETQVVSNQFVQKASFTFVVIGLIWWVLYKIIEDGVNIYVNDERHSEHESKKVTLFWYWVWKIIIAIGFIIGFIIIFN